jgi:hypothetical protein
MPDELPTQPARLKPIWPVRLAVGLIAAVVFVVIASWLPDNRWWYLGTAILFVVSSPWIYGKTRRERVVVVAFTTALAVAGYGALWTQWGHEIIAGTVPGISCPTESSGATNLRACTPGSVAADAPQCESLMLRWLEEAGGSSQRAVSDFGPTVERSGLSVPTSDAPVPPAGNTECVR